MSHCACSSSHWQWVISALLDEWPFMFWEAKSLKASESCTTWSKENPSQQRKFLQPENMWNGYTSGMLVCIDNIWIHFQSRHSRATVWLPQTLTARLHQTRSSSLQLQTSKNNNSICGSGNFFGRKLTSDLDSAGPKTSESIDNENFPRLFGLAKILGWFYNILYLF